MGTLYVVGVPEGAPNDITRRALRVIEEAALVIADDTGAAQRLLFRHDLAPSPNTDNSVEAALETLETADVVLLQTGWLPVPDGLSQQVIAEAIDRGFAVAPVPGASFPITALVISGLPADSFVYLDELPPEPSDCQKLLDHVSSERRTLVVLASPQRLPDTLAALRNSLGSRPVVIVAASRAEIRMSWRGTLGEAGEYLSELSGESMLTLVVGGASQDETLWDEDQLREAIVLSLGRGLRPKEIGRSLASESGWPRREIYDLAVDLGENKV